MKVTALTAGFYDGAIVQPGQQFDVPPGTKGRWFVAADEHKAEPKVAVKSKTKALSEIAKEPAVDGVAISDTPLA